MDITPDMVACAEELAAAVGRSGQVAFRVGDVRHLPFGDGIFDWAWSASCVGYAPLGEPVDVLREVARVVRPGGLVALLVWSSQQLLPGYPLLEAHLNATAAGLAPFSAGERPQGHWMRAIGWLRQVGCTERCAETFVGSAHAPLDEKMRLALADLIAMRWPGAAPELSPEDRRAYERLCDATSPECVLDLPDYAAFWTETLFWGVVGG